MSAGRAVTRWSELSQEGHITGIGGGDGLVRPNGNRCAHRNKIAISTQEKSCGDSVLKRERVESRNLVVQISIQTRTVKLAITNWPLRIGH